jgi:hypothetical protein
MIDQRPRCPADAVQWHISADNRNHALAVFQSLVAGCRFSVMIHRKLAGFRETLRPDSIGGERILWSELIEWRFLIVRRPGADTVMLVEENKGDVSVTLAANDLEAARQTISDLSKALVLVPIGSDPALPIDFWYYGPEGPMTTTRKIELVSWDEIASNYCAETRAGLTSLVEEFKPAKNGGRLLLWHGEPGTGKTYAIRALAWAWREWCRFECVADPERVFESGNYLMEVLMRPDDYEEKDGKWRVLIVEDSGEMIAIDAKSRVGQGLSRLLNVSDGILGQGTRIMILITTNEDLGKLNPAIMRPGRCASEIEFRGFNPEEANRWLLSNGCKQRVAGAHTISELYAMLNGGKRHSESEKIGFRPIVAAGASLL